MTYLLIIIASNFWFVKPRFWITIVNVIGRSIDLLRLPRSRFPNLPLLSLSLFCLRPLPLVNIQNHLVLKKVLVHPHPLESHWLFSHGLVIFLWNPGLKEHLYFVTPISRPPHNETCFAVSTWPSLPYVSRLSSPHIFLFWLYMLNTLAKYSKIFFDSSICNFSKSPHSFCRWYFLYCQLLGLILAKLSMLIWRWLH